MSNIKWEDGAVCFANGEQHKYDLNKLENLIIFDDFQLNEIRQGDYIEDSELDTEQKYDDVVEVFRLFDFEWGDSALTRYSSSNFNNALTCCDNWLWQTTAAYVKNKRKLTYPQIMAIGELKRFELEKSAPKTAPDLTADVGNKTAKDYLNECIEVQNQRGEQYDSKGTGERSFDAAAKAFNAMTGQNIKGSDVCLVLTCVKAVRQYNDPTRVHEDSLLDLVSYASLWAEELNKENNND